jgi:hypothetical protein
MLILEDDFNTSWQHPRKTTRKFATIMAMLCMVMMSASRYSAHLIASTRDLEVFQRAYSGSLRGRRY